MHVVHQRSNATNDYHLSTIQDQYNISYPFPFGSDSQLILPNSQLAFTKYDINTIDVSCSDFERKSDSLAALAELETDERITMPE